MTVDKEKFETAPVQPSVVELCEKPDDLLDAKIDEFNMEFGVFYYVQDEIGKLEKSECTIKDITSRMRFMSGKDKKTAEADLAEAERQKKIRMENIMNDVFALPMVTAFAVGVDAGGHDKFIWSKAMSAQELKKDENRDIAAVSEKVSAFYKDLADKLIISEDAARKIAEEILLQIKKDAGTLTPDSGDGVLSWHAFQEEASGDTSQDEMPKAASFSAKERPYIPFDPKEELLKIGRFSAEETETTTPEQRTAIKRERLDHYKEQLAEQKLGIAEINAELESLIINNKSAGEDSLPQFFDPGLIAYLEGNKQIKKEIDKDVLFQYVESRAEKYRLSDPQMEHFKEVISRILKKDSLVKDFLKNREKETDAEIFEKLFGFRPRGQVTIEQNPASILVIIENDEDFAAVYKGDFTGVVGEDDLEKLKNCSGIARLKTKNKELGNSVAMARAHSFGINRTRTHELRHILHGSILGIEEWGSYPKKYGTKDKTKRADLEYRMQDDAETDLFRTKDEMLAYAKEAANFDWVKETLLKRKEDGGLYDYYKEHEIEYLHLSPINGFDPDYYKKQNERNDKLEQHRQRYEKQVLECIDVMKNLELLGLGRGEIVAMLETEHPLRWSRAFDRFMEAPQFEKRKKEALEALSGAEGKILLLEKQIAYFGGKAINLKEYLDKKRAETPNINGILERKRLEDMEVLRQMLVQAEYDLKDSQKQIEFFKKQKETLESF